MAIYDPFLDEDDDDPHWPSDRPTVSDLRHWAQAMLESYAINDIEVDPVREILFTNQVARSFWGKTWCENLKHWGASKHKLARGRTYVRCGAIVNLRFFDGCAFARVSGTGLYTVSVLSSRFPRSAGVPSGTGASAGSSRLWNCFGPIRPLRSGRSSPIRRPGSFRRSPR